MEQEERGGFPKTPRKAAGLCISLCSPAPESNVMIFLE